LRKLGAAARQELRDMGPTLVDAILRLAGDSRTVKDATAPHRPKTGGTKKAGP
jgi:hypothetical protein